MKNKFTPNKVLFVLLNNRLYKQKITSTNPLTFYATRIRTVHFQRLFYLD